MSYRLGIDLGGTTAKIALVDEKGRVVKSATVPSHGFPVPQVLARQCAETCHRLLDGKKIKRVGVGVAGDIDFDRGVVRVSPNLGWKNVPLKKMLQASFRCDVIVDNDANAAAWGLYKTQVPKSVKNMIAVTLGTGVGGGLVLNGELYRGGTGSAGEVGHMTMDENGRLCNCGNRGCLETYAGAIHLVRRVKEDLAQGQRSSLQKIYKTAPETITPLLLSQEARKGDSYARKVWADVGHVLGLALGNLVYVFNPEFIILTGGIAQAKGLILTPLLKTLRKRTFKTPIRHVNVHVADEAPNMGVIGASLL